LKRTVIIGLSGLLAMVGLTASCGGGGPTPKHISSAELADFSVVSPGIVFELHPSNRPILMSAAADPPLKVCPVGTSFGSVWRHGCRALTEKGRALPTTSGAIHVLFRVAPSKGSVSRVERLSLQWHCIDHRFGLERRRSPVPRTRATFDC
jgi:hypothetical protein